MFKMFMVVKGLERGLRGLCLNLERGLRKGLQSEEKWRSGEAMLAVVEAVVRDEQAKVLSIVFAAGDVFGLVLALF